MTTSKEEEPIEKLLAAKKKVNFKIPRENVRCFSKNENIGDGFKKMINSIVSHWDGDPGLLGSSTRLTICWDQTVNQSTIYNPIGCIIFSYYPIMKHDGKTISPLPKVDIGYKLCNIKLDLEKEGLSTCISTDFDSSKAKEFINDQRIHAMEFNIPAVLYFGIEEDNPNIFKRFISWFYSDTYRLPLSTIVVSGEISSQFKDLFEGFRQSISQGNSQTWRIATIGKLVHFYTTSSLEERYFNIGCALASFWRVAQQKKIKGEFFISSEYPTTVYEYIVSWEYR